MAESADTWQSFRLDDVSKRRLAKCAAQLEMSTSELLRQMVEVYLQADTEARESH